MLDAAKAVAKASGEDQTIVVEATQNSRAQWFKIVIKPVKDKEDHTNFLCSCIEITNEREREETLRALLLEVSHRSKNMLSVVLSIAAQIIVEGDNPQLSPNGATHVGLALHELYTNSITFGALSVPEGKIAISCSKTVIDGIPSAQLIWDETPRVTRGAAPEKSFGRTALEQIVPSAVNGKGKLSVDSDGVRYSLTIGGSELVG